MAKQIRQEDVAVQDVFRLVRESAKNTKIEVDALMRDLAAILPITEKILAGKAQDVMTVDQQRAAMAKLNEELKRAKALQDQQIKDSIALEKIKQAESRTRQTEIREKELVERINQKLTRSEQKTIGLYTRTNQAMNALGKSYRDLAVRKELGIKLSKNEELQLVQLEAKIKKYDNALKTVDAQMGRHQRNVGNYKSGFDGLGNSINQLTREAPAFANSMQTGFMAISNNLPTLFDEIKRLKAANVELAQSGQKTKSVFSQIAGAIFSFQTALSLGVTLLTIYGAEIVDWISKLSTGGRSINTLADANNLLNESLQESTESIARERAELDTLIDIAKDETRSKNERLAAIKRINEVSPEMLGNITLENIGTKQSIDLIGNYIKALDRKAIAQAALNVKTELYNKLLKEEFRQSTQTLSMFEKAKAFVLPAIAGLGVAMPYMNIFKERKEELEAIQSDIDALDKFLKGKISVEDIESTSGGKGRSTKDRVKQGNGILNLPDMEDPATWAEIQAYWDEYYRLVQVSAESAMKSVSGEKVSITGFDVEAEEFKKIQDEYNKAKLDALRNLEDEQILTERLLEIEKERLRQQIEFYKTVGKDSTELEIQLEELNNRTVKSQKNQKELAKLTKEAYTLATNYLTEVLQNQIDQIDAQIERVQRQYDLLAARAEEGNLAANESLKEQLRIEQELLAIQEKRARNQRILAAVTQGLQIVTGQGGGISAGQLAGFKTGTEGTIGEALSGRHIATVPMLGYDDTIVRVNKKEGIINENNMKAIAPYGISRIIQSGVAYERMKQGSTSVNIDLSDTNRLLQEALSNKTDYKVGEVIMNSFDIIRKEVKGSTNNNTVYRVKFPTKR